MDDWSEPRESVVPRTVVGHAAATAVASGYGVGQRSAHGTSVSARSTRPRVPTPTYFSSGPRPSIDAAMAALSDAMERDLQEDLAHGMLPVVEDMALSVSHEGTGKHTTHTAVCLVLLKYERVG
jgi:hypothetical protein